jgi:MFS superfamily sulfate permease-like transporter
MRRMQEIFQARTVAHGEEGRHPQMPRGAVVYEIAGPLFFGAAQKAIHALQFVGDHSKVLVLDVRSVPVLDVTVWWRSSPPSPRFNREDAGHPLRRPGPARKSARARRAHRRTWQAPVRDLHAGGGAAGARHPDPDVGDAGGPGAGTAAPASAGADDAARGTVTQTPSGAGGWSRTDASTHPPLPRRHSRAHGAHASRDARRPRERTPARLP